ncbi:MAG: acetate--CoA ligase family protein [bacterium]|nr:acetate--CoA ligase family protein [bacterium]
MTNSLKYILSPRSIAIVGASSNLAKFTGRTLKYLLKHGYQGKVYPINPNCDEIAGLACYPSVKDLPGPVDTAFIQIAAQRVPEALEQCIDKGVKGAVIHSAGMGEADKDGQRKQAKIKALAGEAGMRVVGPNCAGVANITENIILSPVVCYELDHLTRGRIGLVSQSGGLTGAYVTRAEARGIGFSYVISTGNEMDLEACEYIRYLLHDRHTDVVAVFLEGLRNIEHFIEVADEALEMGKPIIVLKVGRTEVGSKAAATHTGAITGVDAVYDTIFRQKGIIRVETFEDLIEVSFLFSRLKPSAGNRVGVITTTGGGATLLAEAGAQAGLEFPAPSEDTMKTAAEFLPSFAAKSNPMDVTMAGVGGGYQKGLEILLNDDTFDIVVGVVGTSSQFEPEMGVKPILDVYGKTKKPLVAFCSPNAEEALRLFARQGLPSFRTPEACGRALGCFVRHGQFLEEKERPAFHKEEIPAAKPQSDVVKSILSASPKIINEYDSKKILAEFGIPIIDECLAEDFSTAKDIVNKMGYPIALKIVSPDIQHKTEAGVIKLGIGSDAMFETAFHEIMANAENYRKGTIIEGVLIQTMAAKGIEVVVGMSNDAQFGPTLMFGLGGIFVEIVQDVAFRVLPISGLEAWKMIHETKGSALLNGYRGMAKMDIDGILTTLVKISRMCMDLMDIIEELDINPLMVYPEKQGVQAIDALIRKK